MLLLLWAAHSYMEIANYIFRFIVLVEVFQNAWSLSALTSTNARQGMTLLKQAQWELISGPWRTQEDHRDQHRLEDVFLDDDETSSSPSDEDGEEDQKKYHHFDEGTFIFNTFLDGGEIVDRGLVLDENYDSVMH